MRVQRLRFGANDLTKFEKIFVLEYICLYQSKAYIIECHLMQFLKGRKCVLNFNNNQWKIYAKIAYFVLLMIFSYFPPLFLPFKTTGKVYFPLFIPSFPKLPHVSSFLPLGRRERCWPNYLPLHVNRFIFFWEKGWKSAVFIRCH